MKWSTNSWHTSQLPTSSGCGERWEPASHSWIWEILRNGYFTHMHIAESGGLSFISASIPLFCLLLQSSFLPPKYTFEVLFPLWKMWACNTLLWLSGRRVVIVVVVIVPFSIHFRASFLGGCCYSTCSVHFLMYQNFSLGKEEKSRTCVIYAFRISFIRQSWGA